MFTAEPGKHWGVSFAFTSETPILADADPFQCESICFQKLLQKKLRRQGSEGGRKGNDTGDLRSCQTELFQTLLNADDEFRRLHARQHRPGMGHKGHGAGERSARRCHFPDTADDQLVPGMNAVKNAESHNNTLFRRNRSVKLN